MIIELAPKRMEGVKAGLIDGEYGCCALWKSRAEARQQDNTEKQVTVGTKNS